MQSSHSSANRLLTCVSYRKYYAYCARRYINSACILCLQKNEKKKSIVLCGQPNQFHVNVEKRRRKFTTNIASTTRACHRHPHIHHLCILPLLLLWLYRFGCLPSQPAHISGKHLMSLLAFQTCLSRCQNAMTISSMTCDVCST